MDGVLLTLFILAVSLVILAIRSSRSRAHRLPPGPPGLPIIGSLLSLRKHEHLVFTRWRKQYGDVVYFNAGLQKILLLNSYRVMKAAFIDQGDVFSGRFNAPYLREIARHSGIVLTDGDVWREHRRYVLQTLRDLGFGRPVSERIIDSECESLLKAFDSLVGRPMTPRTMMSQTINNVIARLTFGERSGVDDTAFPELLKKVDYITGQVTFATLLPVAFPVILKIPPLLRFVESFAPFRASFEFCHDLIRSKIEEHVAELGPEVANMDASQSNDVCDALLIKRARLEKEGIKHTFTDWQILRNLLELFLAGTDTTSITMTWAFFFLSTNRDVQRRLYEEIVREVGLARRPGMKDRQTLHYACAVMDEVLRRSAVVRTGIPRRTLMDTTIDGFFIPAETTVVPNIYLVHHDPELWEKPDSFYPEHFLDDNGRYRPSPYLCPFSIGKRSCLGESLARMEIFMVLTGVVQSFSIRLADPNADIAAIVHGTGGNFRRPGPHELILDKRDL